MKRTREKEGHRNKEVAWNGDKVFLLWTLTHSSVDSMGRPLGSVVRPLLLQRTTVSRQEHSAGHLSTGEQLLSLLPDRGETTEKR
ncbi:hypothetical protein EYF80_020373 [Liparis tanakae]|uniref:Uncharacterized protein n=1 Tax=Liparis tanakae TaxID=230148 RepID=A0A4Z2HWV3_9TELE|nr:hypothetical protein EYF80_020373 [Liparis tanakae]